jgi:uncharacterized protein YfkK (UPF0435 family)
MSARFFVAIAVFGSIAGSLGAQTYSRRATAMGGVSTDRGKCTIEVVVDSAVDVEIRGDTANLRNLAGQPPQWRRFECNGPLPPNPLDFRFAGVDGRGRQQLVQDPRNGGVAVVRIEDPQSGSEGYTFDLFWSNTYSWGNRNPGYQAGPGYQPLGRDPDAYYRDRNAWFRGQNWRGQLFQRVRQDVEYVQSVTFPGGGDQFRLASTLEELDELQGKLAAGRYDEEELDDVIAALQRVVRDNRLSGRDRDLLTDDVDRLRDFRVRHEEYYGRDEDLYHRDRDDWYRGQNWRGQLFQRVREDLDHVQSATFPFGGDQFRLASTRHELDELQSKLAAGRYDERELDDVIGALQRVVQDNRMSGRDRDVLADDLNRLRDFRTRHDSYGAR